MKQFYILLAAFAFSVQIFAQTEGASKVYGYKQAVLPGTVRVDDNGNELPRKKQYNYFIYLASSTRVTPVEIWINGEPYFAEAISVTAPVEYTHPTSGNLKVKILVPKTTRRVLQLSSTGKKVQKPNKKGKLLSKKNELVIIYKGNGKLYYKTITNLTELERVAMQ
jgi:hypothetical protein